MIICGWQSYKNEVGEKCFRLKNKGGKMEQNNAVHIVEEEEDLNYMEE